MTPALVGSNPTSPGAEKAVSPLRVVVRADGLLFTCRQDAGDGGCGCIISLENDGRGKLYFGFFIAKPGEMVYSIGCDVLNME